MLTKDRQIDRRILLQADSLEAQGWSVRIIAMPRDSEPGDDDHRVLRLQSQADGVGRASVVLRTYRRLRQWVPMDGRLMRVLKFLAWRWFVDPEGFFIHVFADTALRYSPTVFMAHDLPMLPVARLAAQRCGAKLVYDSHELYSEQASSRWERSRWAQIERKYISACDLVFTVNPSIGAELERRYGLHDVRVVYSAERCDAMPPRVRRFHSTFELAADSRVLLMQGGLSAGRNLETLVRAWRYVAQPGLVLVILGDGVLLGKLKALVANLGLGRRVFFHPRVAQKDLLALTVAADAGVIPYQGTCLNNYYATPNKLFEFIAAGLPVLASDLPELRRIVEGAGIGQVGDTRSPRRFAALIDAFFADEARLSHWTANVAEVRKRVCWEVEGARFVSMFESICPAERITFNAATR